MSNRKKVIKYKSIYVATMTKNDINSTFCAKSIFRLQTKDSFEGINISLKNYRVVRCINYTVLRIGTLLNDSNYQLHNFIIYLKSNA